MDTSAATLRNLVDAELRRAAPSPVAALAGQLAQRAGGQVAAVLFYGSALRTDALDGVLDFYVLPDRVGAWPGSRVAAAANRLLPPNVGYFEGELDHRTLRAKYAVMSVKQFRLGMSRKKIDTTLWARFSQPCICAWARSDADREAMVTAVCDAVITAARWAAELGPSSAPAPEFWRVLFAQTYSAELRVERAARGGDIVDRDSSRYAAVLPLAWKTAGIRYEVLADGRLSPCLDARARRSAARRWAWRSRLGKPLNLLRLLKATFTFAGAMDYVAWKVERHSGVRIEVSPWQRRFPLLAVPRVYWQLRKRGLLR